MIAQQVIVNTCKIADQTVVINNEVFFKDTESTEFDQFAKGLYKEHLEKYSKFYKMDPLSKLAFLACQFALKDTDFLSNFDSDKIGVILGNSSATILTDTKYWNTVSDRANYFPSPSDFVYTLPNIMIGEICIKNKIYGENCCLITEKNDLKPVFNYVTLLFESNICDACIAGYVEFGAAHYEATIHLIRK